MDSILNLTDVCLKKWASIVPNHTALILIKGDGETKRFTYKNIYDQILKIASGLKTLKIPKASPFLIRSENSIELILLYFGAIRAGLVPTVASSDLTKREVLANINSIKAKLYYQSDLTALKLELPRDCREIFPSDVKTILSHLTPDSHLPVTYPEDPAFITGEVIHLHRIVYGVKHSITERDVILNTLPLFSKISVVMNFIEAWTVGATIISLLNYATFEDCKEVINRYAATILIGAPYLLEETGCFLAKHPLGLPSLKTLCKVEEEKIASKEIEEVFLQESNLSEVACVETSLENQITLFAVLKNKEHDSDFYMSNLMEIARQNLTALKTPARIVFLDKMPRTPSGMIDKALLQTM